mgnify:CR=1 FL=1
MKTENAFGHKMVVKNLVEQVAEGKNPSLTEAAEEAGYQSNGGQHLRKSETFQKILFNEMPFEWLAKKQKGNTMAWKLEKIDFPSFYERQEIEKILDRVDLPIITLEQEIDENFIKGKWFCLVKFPHWEQIDKALDKIYKIAGLYSAEKHEMVNRPLEEMSDDDLLKLSLENPLPQVQATIEEVKPT